MSGFIATAPSTASGLANDGWWPDVSVQAVRDELRLDGTVTEARLEAALLAAVMTVNDELAAWRAAREAEGHATLADVPAQQIGGMSRLVRLYLRATACCAAADIAEQYRSFDATSAGNQRADALTPSIDELRRNQRWAIRDLLGAGRVTVDLI